LQFFRPLNRFEAVRDFADDLQFWLFLKNRRDNPPKRFKIVSHKNPE
jgi:hypothetical protein